MVRVELTIRGLQSRLLNHLSTCPKFAESRGLEPHPVAHRNLVFKTSRRANAAALLSNFCGGQGIRTLITILLVNYLSREAQPSVSAYPPFFQINFFVPREGLEPSTS